MHDQAPVAPAPRARTTSASELAVAVQATIEPALTADDAQAAPWFAKVPDEITDTASQAWVIDAAEQTRSPVIIGVNGEFLTHSGRLAAERLVADT